ncbi:MFS transporter [Klebsiella pneumoniae]
MATIHSTIISGAGASSALLPLLAGKTSILLVTDKNVGALEATQAIHRLLAAEGREVEVIDSVPAEPNHHDDRLVHKKVLSLTATRKLFLTIGLLMALCIGFAPFTDSVFMTVFLLCVAKSGTTVAASQVWALPGDVAPKNSVSIVAGLQNTVSNMGGAVGPIITGAIVAATGSFNWALIFSAILVVIGIINYLFLMGKIEPINDKGGKSPVLNAAEQH